METRVQDVSLMARLRIGVYRPPRITAYNEIFLWMFCLNMAPNLPWTKCSYSAHTHYFVLRLKVARIEAPMQELQEIWPIITLRTVSTALPRPFMH